MLGSPSDFKVKKSKVQRQCDEDKSQVKNSQRTTTWIKNILSQKQALVQKEFAVKKIV